ncbi:hypothetical protein AQJ67_11930 [Streptomyces caeruleatus]|uniref:Uncharacterized protein n=1 Tax=Streptomyces caeruleatus TaxID=661399 RepID=A0A101U5M7_9ACTN|nr:hypothetical protein AQJ67_11930 [Streptomyces caeruleatus]
MVFADTSRPKPGAKRRREETGAGSEAGTWDGPLSDSADTTQIVATPGPPYESGEPLMRRGPAPRSRGTS